MCFDQHNCYWCITSWRNGVKTLPESPLIASLMGPSWGPSGDDRTQVGPMNLAIWDWPIMRRIHWSSADSSHKGPVMQNFCASTHPFNLAEMTTYKQRQRKRTMISVFILTSSMMLLPFCWSRWRLERGIAMLSVDKFPYPRKQTRGNEFIPCSNNICDILKRFRSFKTPAITLIWPKSPYKHNVTTSYRSGKESGRRSESPLWRHQWRSFVFISHAADVKREIRLYISRLLTNQKRESARSMG